MIVRIRFLTAAAAVALAAVPAVAQQPQPTPEQRIERLERQLRQMQRQVFPRGAPADTAGFSDEPAATQTSVRNIDARLNALERQMTEILRLNEENGNRLQTIERDSTQARSDQQQRISAIENRLTTLESNPTPAASAAPDSSPASRPASSKPATPPKSASASEESGEAAKPAEDPVELAYDEGYELWRQGNYDDAVASLKRFVAKYPKHRRTSWANNLIGRALLDDGEPRAAAEALLANYRANPAGERAADSLDYLGQSLMKLGQATRACNSYAELESVYGSKMRDELKRLLPPAKAEAKCD